MKSFTLSNFQKGGEVALFTRAWIEMILMIYSTKILLVALFTRAWIEIKLYPKDIKSYNVALFTRAWIEMEIFLIMNLIVNSRPLHEGVD